MKSKNNKGKNRKYLQKVFLIKKVFLPLLILLDKIGLVTPFEKRINLILLKFGIKKNVHYFFKYKDFSRIFKNEFKDKEGDKGIILFPIMTGVNGNFTLMNLLYSKFFLERDGLKPVFLVCDSAVKICSKDGMLKSRKTHPLFCHECWAGYKNIAAETGIEIKYFSEFVRPEDLHLQEVEKRVDMLNTLSSCMEFRLNEIPIGEFCRKSVLRYFFRGKFTGESEEIQKYKLFITAVSYYSLMMEAFLSKYPQVKYMIIYNGTLAFESVARFHASARNIPYITQETFLGQNGLIYKKNGEVMNLEWNREYEKYKNEFTLNEKEKSNVDLFFSDLKNGKFFYKALNKEHQNEKLRGIKKYACLFTNMNFDTAVLDRNSIFSSMEDWLFLVIDFWIKNVPDITLLVRIHPGESKIVTASQEFIAGKILGIASGKGNVLIIDSDEKISSYELISNMEYGLIYSSTIGLEIAYNGKLCIVAGMPYFRNKPFVITPAAKEEYFESILKLNAHNYEFNIDREELARTINFVYFERLKKITGIKVYTPEEEPNTIYSTSEEMIQGNLKFFEEFRNELFENN